MINYEENMINTHEVIDLINQALSDKKPLSLSRFGHGEIANMIWPDNELWTKGFEYFKDYAGATVSIEILKKDLIHSLMTSDIIGLHVSSSYKGVDQKCAEITREILKKVSFEPKKVCNAWVTHEIINYTSFWDIMYNNKVAVVGRRNKAAMKWFIKHGINLVDCISLEGYRQIDSVHEHLKNNFEWDIVLISAGIPATIIAPKLAQSSEKVVIDFGHALDILIDGKNFNERELVPKWKRSSRRKQ
ncbi:GT-D fold domain-containing glycosyltransferase [Sutcliffiella horikoshii]|uniref:GT-D fold domain-containing protein n=1 Tax=Sutcliffiella horikoshii TaxID=79883 RepID=UPI001F2DD134|nr:GT-D fold domain-containing glycosyltransferase [Sutcliffiella horikoshii]MCG1020143.1 hypothetical protein [Sutcliffiella horikoshii]